MLPHSSAGSKTRRKQESQKTRNPTQERTKEAPKMKGKKGPSWDESWAGRPRDTSPENSKGCRGPRRELSKKTHTHTLTHKNHRLPNM